MQLASSPYTWTSAQQCFVCGHATPERAKQGIYGQNCPQQAAEAAAPLVEWCIRVVYDAGKKLPEAVLQRQRLR